jgi:YggT family protein
VIAVRVLLYVVLYSLLVLLIARLILSYTLLLSSYRPTGYGAVFFEIVYTITDIPLRPLDRVLPVVRIGRFALSLSFPVLFLAAVILLSQVRQI